MDLYKATLIEQSAEKHSTLACPGTGLHSYLSPRDSHIVDYRLITHVPLLS